MAPAPAPLTAPANRDVDKVLATKDISIAQADKAYLEKHGIEKMLGGLIRNLCIEKPLDPIQYCIDSIAFSADYAKQDPKTGLPEHRRAKLATVFNTLDKEKVGKVGFQGLQDFAQKHGGETLGEEELKSLFRDFQPDGNNLITEPEFLLFFAKVSRTIPNQVFDQLVADLLS